MFGIGIPELILILALALIVLGPDKLPQVAKQIARFMGELKRASDEFKSQLELDAIKEIRERNIWEHVDGLTKEGSDRAGSKDKDVKKPDSGTPGGLGPEWKEARGPEGRPREGEGPSGQKEDGKAEAGNRVD